MPNFDFEKAMADPAAVFHSPEEIVQRADLTHDEKRELLGRWRQDEIDLSPADHDGTADDSSLIRRIARALANLDVTTGEPKPTSH